MKFFNLNITNDNTIEQIRIRLLYAILFILSALGIPTIVIAGIEAYMLQQFSTILIYLLFFAPVLIVTLFRKKLSYKLIVYVVIGFGYLIASSNIVIYGIGGAGIPIFFLILVLTTVFFNLKAGLYMILFSMLSMCIIGFLYVTKRLELDVSLDEISTKLISWLTAIAVLVFLGSLIVLSYGLLQYKMFQSIKLSKQNAEELTLVNQQLNKDIAERKMAEKTLNESQVRYQTLFDNMLEAIAYQQVLFEGDKPIDYVFIEVNNSFYRLTDYEDVIGKRVSELVPGIRQSNPGLIERYGRVALTGKSERYETYIAETNSWFFTTLFSIGNNIVVSMFDNISEKKLAENELRRSEEEFRSLYSNSPFGIMICSLIRDSKGKIIDFIHKVGNPAVEPQTGFNLNDLVGKKASEIADGKVLADLIKKYGDVVTKGETINYTQYFDVYDRTLDVRVYPMHDDLFIINFVDISARKKAEQELLKHTKNLEKTVNERTNELTNSQTALVNIVEDLNEKSEELEQSSHILESKNKELETFTYSVSHDLKAPLRGIDGYSRLLEDSYYDVLDEEGKKFVKTIREGTKQMNQLIEDLLAYSRLERASFQASSINAIQFIDNMLLNFKDNISKKNIIIEKEIHECNFLANTNGLTIAFRNILENAIKFSSQVDSPKIKIVLKDNVSSLILSVKDNGIGFDMKYKDRIFEIFQRLNLPEQFPGTGIGLTMVHKTMERMNGKVWAESSTGNGAAFYLEIPKK